MVAEKIGKILFTDFVRTCKVPYRDVPIKTPLNGLRLATLETDTFEIANKTVKYSQDEIIQAYRKYINSNYINANMREGVPLSENSEKMVNCLKQAIDESEPVTGKFYRVLSSDNDEQTVKYILNNAGFTSTTPEANKNYTTYFSVGSHSAMVEFDLKTPIKGYKGCDYEVLFAPNTFTADKYEITKIKDGFFRVTEKAKPEPIRFASITSHYDEGKTPVFGYLPDNYIKETIMLIPEEKYVARFGPNKGQIKTAPAHEEHFQELLPHYHIDKLWTGGKGTGTSAVQNVVRRSVEDSRTAGRVTLDACCLDGKTSPAGFYYKLGFRFKDPALNKKLEDWLLNGGLKENSPFFEGMMFLPKENIQQCLNYVPKH